MKSGIYKIQNIISGKIYIGSSKIIIKRIKEHKYLLKKNAHSNRFLQRAWNKNGEDAFTFSILLYCSKDALITNEQLFLDKYKSYEKEIGYNIRKIAECNYGLRGGEKQKEAVRKIWERPEYRIKRNVPLSGERHGRLVLLELKEKTAGSHTWLCKCDCGKQCLKKVGCLRRGDTLSCGCLNAEEASKRRKDKRGIPTAFVELDGKKISIRSAERKLNIGIGGITRKARVKSITKQESCDYFSQRDISIKNSITEYALGILGFAA